ncbi:hypothetical protein V8G54_014307 [Vigna mungo]|uniref:Uncharacterized protein n=1 Tax=Vigna mungo TaxID=3915 RepID=A0AAQ3NHE6_VIGMU
MVSLLESPVFYGRRRELAREEEKEHRISMVGEDSDGERHHRRGFSWRLAVVDFVGDGGSGEISELGSVSREEKREGTWRPVRPPATTPATGGLTGAALAHGLWSSTAVCAWMCGGGEPPYLFFFLRGTLALVCELDGKVNWERRTPNFSGKSRVGAIGPGLLRFFQSKRK